MNALLLATLLVLGLGSIFLLWKKDKRLVVIFNVLFVVVLMQWAASLFDKNGTVALHVLTGVVVLGYLIAQFLPRKKVIGALVSTVLVLGTFFATGTGEMTLNGGASQAETKFIVLAIVVASFVPFLILTILGLLTKLIPQLSASSWTAAAYPLLAGIAFLYASLTAPVYGPMLVGAAFLINSFFDDKRSGITAVSLFAFAAIPLLLVGESLSVSILNADVIAGLLIGTFSITLVNKIWSGKKNLVLVTIGYALIFGVTFGFTFLGKIFQQMGGFDTYVAILIGAALANAIKGKGYRGVSLLAPIFAFGLTVPSLLVNKELEAAQQDIITVSTNSDEKDENGEKKVAPTILPITDLSGKYTISEEPSLIQFELGDEGGRTKGQFKKVSGSFQFPDDLSKAKVNVTLSMSDFTTFNKMRDESLRGDEYFKTDEYPKMRFKGSGFTEKEDNLYEVKGSFNMLGVSKPVTVTIQRVEVEGRIVLIGSGSLDRTKFGMTPSAAEGNVVDFNYQVELNQK